MLQRYNLYFYPFRFPVSSGFFSLQIADNEGGKFSAEPSKNPR
jgi:hypothetical protein